MKDLNQSKKPWSRKVVLLCSCLMASIMPVSTVTASGFSEARFIEVVNEVRTVSLPDRDVQPAAVDSVLQAPNLVQTGRRSRAQLQTSDGTIARVGSNTIFSFDSVERSVDLEQGSLLFHSPSGKGGGRIVTASATASVLGTTIIVAATNDGGFKVLVLEGTAQVDFPDGTSQQLGAGQMTFILPSATPGGPSEPGPVLNFDLEAQLEGSSLVNDFNRPLESMPQINNAVQVQRDEIVRGELQPTGLVIVGANSDVSIRTVDASLLSIAVREGDRTALEQLRALLDATVTLTTAALPDTNVVSSPLVVSPADLGFTAFNPPATIPFVGIAAGTVIIQTPSVDFSSLDGAAELFILGNDLVRIEQDTHFIGFEETQLFTIAGGNLDFGSHYVVASFPYGSSGTEFTIVSRNDFFLEMATVSNPGGDLDITAQGLMQFISTDLFAGDFYSFGDHMRLEAFEIDFDGVYAQSSGSIEMRSTGDAVISNTTLSANGGGEFLMFTMGDGDFDGGTEMGSYAEGLGLIAANIIDINVANLTASRFRIAASDVNLTNVTFHGVGSTPEINMSARTIILDTVAFPDGSIVSMKTQYGQLAPNPNTSASPLPGFVNFVKDVTYGGNPAQNYVPTSVGGSASPSNERIFINTLSGGSIE